MIPVRSRSDVALVLRMAAREFTTILRANAMTPPPIPRYGGHLIRTLYPL